MDMCKDANIDMWIYIWIDMYTSMVDRHVLRTLPVAGKSTGGAIARGGMCAASIWLLMI